MSNEISQSVDDDLKRYGQIKTDYDDLRSQISGKGNQTDVDSLTSSMATNTSKIGILSSNLVYLANYIPNFNSTTQYYYNCDTPFANAVTACRSGGILVLPPGQLFISTPVTINNPITIMGGYGSVVEQQGQCDGFIVNCDNVHFINVEVENTLYWNSSNYSIIQAGDFTGMRFLTGRRHIVDKCGIFGFSTNIHFVSCDFFSVTNNYISKSFNYGILVENQSIPDDGDTVISHNVISGGVNSSYPSTALIKQRSGGGLKILGNKLLTGQVGIQLLIPSNVQTGVFIIEGNSVEGQTLHNLHMAYETGATSSSFVRSNITGNEFLGNLVTSDAVLIDGSIIPSSMKDIIFTDNHIAGVPTTSGINGLNVNGVTNITINQNEISGGYNGIIIGSYTNNYVIDKNMILKNGSCAIKNVGYSGNSTNQVSNIKHTSVVQFQNASKVNPVNTVLMNLASGGALGYFKMIIDVVGSINSPASEQFYVHQEYLVSAISTGQSATLLSSASAGLPITVTYSSGGIVTVTRNDSYADGTYTLTGTAKVSVDGMPYSVGANNIGIG